METRTTSCVQELDASQQIAYFFELIAAVVIGGRYRLILPCSVRKVAIVIAARGESAHSAQTANYPQLHDSPNSGRLSPDCLSAGPSSPWSGRNGQEQHDPCLAQRRMLALPPLVHCSHIPRWITTGQRSARCGPLAASPVMGTKRTGSAAVRRMVPSASFSTTTNS